MAGKDKKEIVGYETGRNGTFDITDILVYNGKDEVGIFGKGKRAALV
jgi:hypothetical protein